MHGWIFHNTNLGCRKTKLIALSVTANYVNKVLVCLTWGLVLLEATVYPKGIRNKRLLKVSQTSVVALLLELLLVVAVLVKPLAFLVFYMILGLQKFYGY